MVDANFIFILVFLSRLTFVQFGIHSVVSSGTHGLFDLKLFYLLYVAFTLHIFHHVHPTL